ncbi:hypothetical protein CAPTEDRAFT_208422 [Capitella teleta]|uniref:G-protein coupled receptors family 1 profile domain-containing protein n=1 Tax=Capitella teleta TaxID=283909 RepID=R7UMQ8_CAPTE|nr:hypothetical protein CAPTEDRAFT_208422 [Capitella teleta]|eukprot:ELU07383.1 hypothetical protein CAPTEDRAFT_208422 [Capitella teleta]
MDDSTNYTVYLETYMFYYWRFQSVPLLITIWIIFSNSLTLATIYKSRVLRSTNIYMLVACLAGVDLWAGLMLIPHLLLTHVRSIGDFRWCMATLATGIFPMYNTIQHQGLITMDRYLAIMHPLLYETIFTTQRLKIAIITSWLTSLLCTMIGFAFPTDAGYCFTLASADSTYLLSCVIGPYFIFCIVFALMHARIWKVASLQMYTDETSAKGQKLQLAFSVCWTLLYSNSGVNFLIYAFGNSVFREKLMKILPKFCQRTTTVESVQLGRLD